MRIRFPTRGWAAWFLLALCAIAAIWAYAPGLHGGFLFDDFANLPALGATGPVDHWGTFWRYITSGHADPTGRPLAMLSFLIDAHDWPASPYPFKRGNLILHLANGLLLALLLRKLGRTALPETDAKRIEFAAMLGAAFWLLHPLFVSTTLYIVQREAMLPATFTLLGLLAWLRGREAIHGNQRIRGLCWIALGLGGCTLLGTLGKANGILLPALALVIEYALLRPAANAQRTHTGQVPQTTYRRAMLLFAWLPAGVVAAYLFDQGWNGFVHGISAARPWTLGQRLLTEPRVLMDYLGLLWLPHPFTPGLFNDHIKASTTLWSPASTVPAILAIIGLIALAWRMRRRHPALAAAVLFYFVGQSLESSTVALELYFEHRNYLPAMLMFWPLALWLCGVRSQHVEHGMTVVAAGSLENFPSLQKKLGSGGFRIWATKALDSGFRRNDGQMASTSGTPAGSTSRGMAWAKAALAIGLVLGLSLMTHARAALWGNTHDQALLWARLNPDSPRAQAFAAQVEMNAGHPALAVARLRPALARAPDQAQLALNLFAAECRLGHVDTTTSASVDTALRTMRDPGSLLTSWFTRVIDQIPHPPCPELTVSSVSNMLATVGANTLLKGNAGREQDLYYLKGRLALLQGKGNMALADFNQALDRQVRPGLALDQAALLGAHGFPTQGLEHLQHYDAIASQIAAPGMGMPLLHAWVLQRQHYWPRELSRLRATLRSDAARQPANTR